jgi:hypothetical protein
MGKSNYPEKYDTSVEIPQVRGNINDISIDLLSSIRSAIFQIERTLGINPQGSATNTVAERLSKSIDASGNIKKEAFDSAGVIYGPITNDLISSVAAIDESKLKLNFPTSLLQTEINLTLSKLNNILSQLEEVSSKLSSHIYLDTPNRHTAKSIYIDQIIQSGLETAKTSIGEESLHDFLSDLLNGHIKYTGANISELNNSHLSNQIWFDSSNVSDIISSNNVQSALEDIAIIASGQEESHQNTFHGNGYLNYSNIELLNLNNFYYENIQVSFTEPLSVDSSRKTKIFITTPFDLYNIGQGDIVSLNLSSGNVEYVISDIFYTGLNVSSFNIFGSLPESSNINSVASFRKRDKQSTVDWGWSTTVIEYPDLLSANLIKIANPRSPGVISRKFSSNSVLSTNTFTIEINGKEYTIESYKPGYQHQTIESTISAINESLLEQGAGALAYKVLSKNTGQYELAIISNFSDEESYIKISSTSNSLELLKLDHLNNKIIYGNNGSILNINGVKKLDNNIIFSLNGLQLDVGLNSISGANFSEYELKVGDMIDISGSEQDDGSYIIESILSDRIFVNSSQLQSGIWTSTSDEATNFKVNRNIVSLNSYNFIGTIASPQGTLLEIILDKNLNPSYRTKLEYKMTFYSGDSLYSIIESSNVSQNISEILYFKYDGTDLYCYFSENKKQKITNYKNKYVTIFSENYNFNIKIIIYNADDIISYMSSLSITELSREVYAYGIVDYESIILLSALSYSSANARVEGGFFRLPYVLDLKDTGSLKYKDLSRDSILNIQQIPTMELRNSGIINGLEILNVSLDINLNYIVNVSPGTAYISGKRFSFEKFNSINTGIDSTSFDKIILFINKDGILFADSANSLTCNFSINSNDNIILGTIEYNNIEFQIIDQRLLISDLDFKILNSVTVSPVNGMGHFTSINKAIKYVKRFSQIYPNAGIPEIKLKSGTHRIEVDTNSTFASVSNLNLIEYSELSGILIDFPVKISGEGDSTVLDIINGYSDYPISSDDRSTSARNRGYIIINGSASSNYPAFSNDNFSNGNIYLENFKLKNGTILVVDPLVSNNLNKFIFDIKIKNIYFDWSNFVFPNVLGSLSLTNYFINGFAISILPTSPTLLSNFGGLTIDSCIFDTCYIDFSSSISYSNILISNNSFLSRDELSKPLARSFLIKVNSLTSSTLLENNNLLINNKPSYNLYNNGYLLYNSLGSVGLLASEAAFYLSKNKIGNDSVSLVDDAFLINSSGVIIDGDLTVNNNLNILNDVTISGNLTSSGLSTFGGTLLPETVSIDVGDSSNYFRAGYFTTLRSSILNTTTLAKIGSAAIVLKNTADTSVPGSKLHIRQNSDSVVSGVGPGLRLEGPVLNSAWDIYYTGLRQLQFSLTDLSTGVSSDRAYIQDSGSNTVLNFTGQHKCCTIDSDNIDDYKSLVGLIVVSSGSYSNIAVDKTLPTINESLPKITLSSKKNQKNVFGVVSDSEDLNSDRREYAIGAFVTIFDKKMTKDDTRVVVNSLGEGGIWVIDQSGDLENGDYITTSDVPGYGMRQDDDILRNYTVAKITENCNFDNISKNRIKNITFNGKQYRAVFVGCTYHCG